MGRWAGFSGLQWSKLSGVAVSCPRVGSMTALARFQCSSSGAGGLRRAPHGRSALRQANYADVCGEMMAQFKVTWLLQFELLNN